MNFPGPSGNPVSTDLRITVLELWTVVDKKDYIVIYEFISGINLFNHIVDSSKRNTVQLHTKLFWKLFLNLKQRKL